MLGWLSLVKGNGLQNRTIVGPNPSPSSILLFKKFYIWWGKQSGQMLRAVNPPTNVFGGSNPPLTTIWLLTVRKTDEAEASPVTVVLAETMLLAWRSSLMKRLEQSDSF